jgi:hypothetical protein
MMEVEQARLDLIKRTKKGIAMFYVGTIYWFILGMLSFVDMEINMLALVYLIGAGMLFPTGILASSLLKIDFIAKNNPLSSIGGFMGAMQMFFAPILVLVFMEKVQWLPFFIAILTGAHFFPFIALYKSKAYVFQTIGVVTFTSIVGFLFMKQIYYILPFGLSAIYFITSLLLKKEII